MVGFMARNRLSEIEACVLALVSVDGPATPYAIRKVFLNSPSPQWSGSAGTIYPLIDRLLRERLIRSKLCLTGKRRGHQISLTPAGSRTLSLWFSLPIPDWVVGVPPDPLRTRIRFLSAVSANQRRAFLQNARQRTQAQLRVVEADCERKRAKGGLPYLMARGALLSMQSRCAFLREVADALDVPVKVDLRLAKNKRRAATENDNRRAQRPIANARPLPRGSTSRVG
jgi:DNA-binding PadR family transcriptional regulator